MNSHAAGPLHCGFHLALDTEAEREIRTVALSASMCHSCATKTIGGHDY